MQHRMAAGTALILAALGTTGCADETTVAPPASCVEPLEVGSDTGHEDVFGAKAAGQARAARLASAADIAQPAHDRQPIQDGDFVLANDKIAVVIEDLGLSDGYGRFGGEILTIDEVGDDGKPLGKSRYVETLVGVGLTMPNPTSVAVLRDGSDGGEAVVRVIGELETIPFLDGSISNLFPSDYDYLVAYDYVLAPGEERLQVRLSVVNPTTDPIDLGELKSSSDEIYGFFQNNHNDPVTLEHGFGTIDGSVQWVGFVSGPWNFAWRNKAGPMEFGLEVSGFVLFNGPGFLAEPCAITTSDRVDLIAGGPDYDGLREAIRRVDGEAAGRAISGSVVDDAGTPIAGAYVHELSPSGDYLSRTKTAADGTFTIHAPPSEAVRLHATTRGHVHTPIDVDTSTSDVTLTFAPHGSIHVTAVDMAASEALPVRVQVIPTDGPLSLPDAYGVPGERDGRLHQDFALSGDTTLVVPPGEHRVIVSRGYEYELHDETVTVAAGATVDVSAVLEHSVDSTGIMCGDFHIHSRQSADSSDPIDLKVSSAIADGLDIPCSSEHEWVVDFGPVVQSLGMEKWAFGMGSEELTTFQYGHFGVVPVTPQRGAYNNGAVDWIARTPAEVFDAVDELSTKPALIINHPRGGIGGYFSSVALNEQGEPGFPELWSDNFDIIEVFNDDNFDNMRTDVVADWFTLLNNGHTFWAVGSSDSHSIRSSPVGYARTCMDFGHDDPQMLTPEAVRDALLSGNHYPSGGLMMRVEGPGGESPGETITGASGSVTLTVTVDSPSWVDADNLEVIVNGTTVSTETLMPLGSGTSNRYVNTVDVPLEAGGGRQWIVLHARGMSDLAPLHPGRMAFAVSNPIFVE